MTRSARKRRLSRSRKRASAGIDAAKPSAQTDLPIGGKVRVARLDNLPRVKRELSRVYSEARRREGRFPEALTAQRLANVLGHVRTLIELEEFGDRLSAIEEKLNARP